MNRCVLVVDDYDDMRDLLGSILEGAGFEVALAGDGVAALSAAAMHQPAAIVLDLAMPGMSGVDVARRLRADPRLGHIPIIAYTAHEPMLDGAEPELFDEVCRKPCRPEVLIRLLRRLTATGERARTM